VIVSFSASYAARRHLWEGWRCLLFFFFFTVGPPLRFRFVPFGAGSLMAANSGSARCNSPCLPSDCFPLLFLTLPLPKGFSFPSHSSIGQRNSRETHWRATVSYCSPAFYLLMHSMDDCPNSTPQEAIFVFDVVPPLPSNPSPQLSLVSRFLTGVSPLF